MAKTKYREEHNQLIFDLIVEKNLNNKQCIEFLEIDQKTFYKWVSGKLETYSKFLQSFKEAKKIKAFKNIDFLEEQTCKHITGYFVEEIDTDIRIDKDGKKTEHIKKSKRWVSGSGNVLMHEKKNADPKRWNETQKIEAQVEVTNSLADLIKKNKVVIDSGDDEEL